MPLKVVSFIKIIPVFAKLIKQVECYGNLSICRGEGFDVGMERSRDMDLFIEQSEGFTLPIKPSKELNLSMEREFLMELEI